MGGRVKAGACPRGQGVIEQKEVKNRNYVCDSMRCVGGVYCRFSLAEVIFDRKITNPIIC